MTRSKLRPTAAPESNNWTKERLDWLDKLYAEPALSLGAKATAYAVSSFTNSETLRTDPSQRAIAQRLGCSERTVHVYINELHQAGWLNKRHRFGASIVYAISCPSVSSEDVCGTGGVTISEDACGSDAHVISEGISGTGDSGGSDASVPQTSSVQFRKRLRTNPSKEPFKRIICKGAAHQAPASADLSPPSSTGPVLPAAGAASDGPLPRCPANTCTTSGFLSPDATELLDLIDAAEEFRKTNPELTRRDYSPPRLTEAEALALHRVSPRSSQLREDAEAISDLAGLDGGVAPEDTPAIVELVRMLHDDPPMDAVPDLAAEVRERANRARRITLHKAAQVVVAEKVSGFVVVEDDEVPF